MLILEDTRQQNGKHNMKADYFDKNGVSVIRNKLPFGDYCLPPKVAVDTKRNIEEIAGNIGGKRAEHERFKRECISARDAGCKLYFLTENTYGITSIDEVHNWINPRCIEYPNCIQGDRLEKAMKTMSKRYGCEFLFCKPEESAEIILKLLTGGE